MLLNSVPNPISLCILQKGFISQNIIDYCTWQRQKRFAQTPLFYKTRKIFMKQFSYNCSLRKYIQFIFRKFKNTCLVQYKFKTVNLSTSSCSNRRIPISFVRLENVSTGLRLLGYKTKCHLDSIVQKYISEDWANIFQANFFLLLNAFFVSSPM